MLQVEHLTRRYGPVTAVDDLSFEISEVGVYGFLGPNGAGKSTTMNIMTGCLSATAGTVKISGYDIYDQPREAKRRIGYLPEQPSLYLGETPEEYLRFVGEAKGLRGETLRQQMEAVIEDCEYPVVSASSVRDIVPCSSRALTTLSRRRSRCAPLASPGVNIDMLSL